ncbi:MAG: type II toxin-antitoxin system RelE/ParE family toxin [Desulfovibrio sp.]|nr:type II toxin-antitoxin system RelE/ParE family toxin [Desulfovibrio sp.]
MLANWASGRNVVRIFREKIFSLQREKYLAYFQNSHRSEKSLSDTALCLAVEEMENGLVDANLGGYVYKKRVALPGRGKRGSARTIIATSFDDRWIFLFGFENNERASLKANELRFLQEIAKDLLRFSDTEIADAIKSGELMEIYYDKTK